MAGPSAQAGADADVDLLRQVAAGDRRALDELYRQHAPWLTARLMRRCGDPDIVDTAVQDTFVDVWRNASKFTPSSAVGAWIWTIGIRRLIDQLRKRRPPSPVGDMGPENHAIFHAVIAEEIPLALADTPVGQAFERLEPELQQVLAAVVFCGLTTKEAGRLLGIPTGTVKSRLARARARLKEQL